MQSRMQCSLSPRLPREEGCLILPQLSVVSKFWISRAGAGGAPFFGPPPLIGQRLYLVCGVTENTGASIALSHKFPCWERQSEKMRGYFPHPPTPPWFTPTRESAPNMEGVTHRDMCECPCGQLQGHGSENLPGERSRL